MDDRGGQPAGISSPFSRFAKPFAVSGRRAWYLEQKPVRYRRRAARREVRVEGPSPVNKIPHKRDQLPRHPDAAWLESGLETFTAKMMLPERSRSRQVE
jgi:hypothetical protein